MTRMCNQNFYSSFCMRRIMVCTRCHPISVIVKNRSIHQSFMMLGKIAFTMSVYGWFDNIFFFFFHSIVLLLDFMRINSFAQCVWFHFLLWVCICVCLCMCEREFASNRNAKSKRDWWRHFKTKYTKCIHAPHIYTVN